MPNKLKNLFAEKEDFYKGIIRFDNKESYSRFADAINKVYKTGDTVQVDGIKSMDWGVDLGTGLLPLDQSDRIEDFTIGPSVEEHSIPIKVNGKTMLYPLNKIIIENGIILQSKYDAVISIKLIFNQEPGIVKLSFAPHIEKAPNVQSVIEGISQAEGLLDAIIDSRYSEDENYKVLKYHLKDLRDTFERLLFVEEKYDKNFNLNKIDLQDSESLQDLFELCLTARDNKAIRINARMNFSELNSVRLKTDNVISEGSVLDMTYLGEMEYFLWGESVKLHSANLLHNAIAKKIEELENGNMKIIYGEDENSPMTISYKGFIDEAAAKEELKQLMNHKEDYVNAKTVDQFYNDQYGTQIREM